jgi:hypothetical protein
MDRLDKMLSLLDVFQNVEEPKTGAFRAEDSTSRLLRNVGKHLTDHMAQPRKQQPSRY